MEKDTPCKTQTKSKCVVILYHTNFYAGDRDTNMDRDIQGHFKTTKVQFTRKIKQLYI